MSKDQWQKLTDELSELVDEAENHVPPETYRRLLLVATELILAAKPSEDVTRQNEIGYAALGRQNGGEELQQEARKGNLMAGPRRRDKLCGPFGVRATLHTRNGRDCSPECIGSNRRHKNAWSWKKHRTA